MWDLNSQRRDKWLLVRYHNHSAMEISMIIIISNMILIAIQRYYKFRQMIFLLLFLKYSTWLVLPIKTWWLKHEISYLVVWESLIYNNKLIQFRYAPLDECIQRNVLINHNELSTKIWQTISHSRACANHADFN